MTVQCASKKQTPHTFTVFQLNDVYEITPLGGTDEGGMARVATLRDSIIKTDLNTITVLSGDFVSPSYIGTLKYYDSANKKDQTIAGKQMIETMNELGVDIVTFGNHEFDIPVNDLQLRLNESKFTWISSNVLQRSRGKSRPFIKYSSNHADTIMPYTIRKINYANNESVSVGFIGVTLPFNIKDSIKYLDIYSSVQDTYNKIRPQCNVVIALTHLSFEMDSLLAIKVPGLDLILGGHEHENNYKIVGQVPISKADANAKSVYTHNITYDPAVARAKVSSKLLLVNNRVSSKNSVDRVVNKWITLMQNLIRAKGYDPQRKVMKIDTVQDGRESEIRNRATNYTKLIGNALLYAEPEADAALYNSGSLRVDDELSGSLTEYDVLRSLPFGGPLVIVKISGSNLNKVLDIGTIKNKGTGGYLQFANIKFIDGKALIEGKLIDSSKTYSILMPRFVAEGNESNLEFIKQQASFKEPKNFRGEIRNDIVDVVVAYLDSRSK